MNKDAGGTPDRETHENDTPHKKNTSAAPNTGIKIITHRDRYKQGINALATIQVATLERNKVEELEVGTTKLIE